MKVYLNEDFNDHVIEQRCAKQRLWYSAEHDEHCWDHADALLKQHASHVWYWRLLETLKGN